MPEDHNTFYKEQYFDQLNTRLDTLETKIDDLSGQITWIKAWSAGAGAIVALVIEFVIHYLKRSL